MAGRTAHQLELDGRTVTLSNLDKPMFPSGFTKGQAIDFYIRVSEWLLPHLRKRPITLKRYPNGIAARHFYEKDAPKYTPKWVGRFPVPRRSGEKDICYVLIGDVASLVWSVNLANLEMHPFLHRVPALQTPTAMVFDLDPGEGAGILECAEVAFLLKRDLESDGLQSFPKVSGSKGLQVYVPLNTRVEYAVTKPYARALAERLSAAHPDRIVSAMSKALRRGKVFIDWSQNSDFKTTVAPYSLRARQAQPYVSLPVRWEELTGALKKGAPQKLYFEPDGALSRLSTTGDLFAPVLSLRQKMPRSGRTRTRVSTSSA